MTTEAVILNAEKISYKTEVEKFTKGQTAIYLDK
jgi:hypothetical protein